MFVHFPFTYVFYPFFGLLWLEIFVSLLRSVFTFCGFIMSNIFPFQIFLFYIFHLSVWSSSRFLELFFIESGEACQHVTQCQRYPVPLSHSHIQDSYSYSLPSTRQNEGYGFVVRLSNCASKCLRPSDGQEVTIRPQSWSSKGHKGFTLKKDAWEQ